MAGFTRGELIKRKITDELVACDTHFNTDQLVAVLDILDKVGIPAMYEALLRIFEKTHDPVVERYVQAILAKIEGK